MSSLFQSCFLQNVTLLNILLFPMKNHAFLITHLALLNPSFKTRIKLLFSYHREDYDDQRIIVIKTEESSSSHAWKWFCRLKSRWKGAERENGSVYVDYRYMASEGAVTKPHIMTITTRRTASLSHNNNVSVHNTNDFCPHMNNMTKKIMTIKFFWVKRGKDEIRNVYWLLVT